MTARSAYLLFTITLLVMLLMVTPKRLLADTFIAANTAISQMP
jgi:hypothetical protein